MASATTHPPYHCTTCPQTFTGPTAATIHEDENGHRVAVSEAWHAADPAAYPRLTHQRAADGRPTEGPVVSDAAPGLDLEELRREVDGAFQCLPSERAIPREWRTAVDNARTHLEQLRTLLDAGETDRALLARECVEALRWLPSSLSGEVGDAVQGARECLMSARDMVAPKSAGVH